jgi:hypothetical protein
VTTYRRPTLSKYQFLVVMVCLLMFGTMTAVGQQPGPQDGKPTDGSKSTSINRNEWVATNNTFVMLAIIALAGALGGLVMGFDSSRANKVVLPFQNGRSITLGFFGDMLIGSAASLSIHFVADPIFNPTGVGDTLRETRGIVREVSLGVISGFAGIKVLFSMSEIPTRLINASKAQMIDRMQEQDRSRELLRQVEDALRQIDAKRKDGDKSGAITDLEKAEQAIEHVLTQSQQDPRALVVKAKVLRRKAELDVGSEAAKWWQNAIDTLSDALKVDPSYDRAFYNRACYYAIKGDQIAALADLRQAVAYFAPNKIFARDDDDFVTLRTDKEFQKLIK